MKDISKMGERMLNKFNKPATLRTRENSKATMLNPLAGLEITNSIERDCFAELTRIIDVFRACDHGEHRGPFAINSPHHFTILFESFEQREAFRKAVALINHGEQYWAGDAFFGSLDILKSGRKGPNFSARPNPFAKAAPEKISTDNAVKYSHLRAEAKKTAEKLKAYTEDRTWISICFDTPQDMEEARKRLGLPAEKFVHVEDMLAAIQKTFGVALDVPIVPFALRAESRPDKALNALVE